MTKNTTPKLRFSQCLVLNQYMLLQFGAKKFADLSQDLKQSNLEEIDSDGITGFLPRILQRKELLVSKDKLYEYDRNIVRHLGKINASRDERIRLKYFQYLTLLFVEYYLDMYFNDKEVLLSELNETVKTFNSEHPKDKLPLYEKSELNKIALWNATGSGKTILMHLNYYQYLHYTSNSITADSTIILLTPNESLSAQHIAEFEADGIKSKIYDKNESRAFSSDNFVVQVLENTKLAEKDGDKTVAVSRFGNKNLVFVDEGHKGSSGMKWMPFRQELCKDGFSFEYSATFGQAVADKDELLKQYAKCILFDYSYSYFHGDGYGKDYKILNMADAENELNAQKYLTACLLTFYQQKKLYKENASEFIPFNAENPLFIFVGHSVTGSINNKNINENKESNENTVTVTDVVTILNFFKNFISNKEDHTQYIKDILEGKSGLLHENRDIFGSSFEYLSSIEHAPARIYADILALVFNASNSSGELRIANVKGIDGEIAIRVGENPPFGLINVGDASGLIKILKEKGFNASTLDIGHSLFKSINNATSKINLLVGSKKFTEGWNCWRVSTMGLMNVGKKEGSEIIQLFGRGVRLKGYNHSLKRSNAYKEEHHITIPKNIEILETLNVFGIKSNYMQAFRDAMTKEDIPTDNENIFQIKLPVIKNKEALKKKLRTLRLPEGVDYKKQAPKPVLELWIDEKTEFPKIKNITVDCYSRLQSESSLKDISNESEKNSEKLDPEIVNLFDFNEIWLELEKYKNEKQRHNVIIKKEKLYDLLKNNEWYKIFIPEENLKVKKFSDIHRLQNIAVTLLKKYFDKFYSVKKNEWETPKMQYFEMDENDPNYTDNEEYSVIIPNIEKNEELKNFVEKLKENVEEARRTGNIESLNDKSQRSISSYALKNSCYNPFLYIAENPTEIKISPVALVKSEYQFVEDLKNYLIKSPQLLENAELYIIRNKSKKGVGFFVDSGFYPDFIMWILKDDKQYVTFIDPHGMGRESIEGSKVKLFELLKQIENSTADKSIILNSFILSRTEYADLVEHRSKEEWNRNHVLFMKDNNYIQQLIEKIVF